MSSSLIDSQSILLTCPLRMASFLEQEIQSLGFSVEKTTDTGIFVKGGIRESMAICLHSRIASRVLLLLKEFYVKTPLDLYRSISSLPWEDILPDDGYFTVISSVDTPAITNTQFAQQKCKDAIVDRIRNKMGIRPNSGSEQDKAVIFLYWHGSKCAIYVDMSGSPLHKRGYRLNPWRAPMRENLAAVTIFASNWLPESMPFVNPMCGSGTLAIEAALMATETAPALYRKNFGFMHVYGYDKQLWHHLLSDANTAKKTIEKGRIIASDIHPGAIRIAKENAENAGVLEYIDFSVGDFASVHLPEGPGTVIMNPAYGDRMGEETELEAEYKRIGDFLKQSCSGYNGYIFTGNVKAAKSIGLRTKRKIELFNADIDCRLLEFELYSGTKKIIREED